MVCQSFYTNFGKKKNLEAATCRLKIAVALKYDDLNPYNITKKGAFRIRQISLMSNDLYIFMPRVS